MYKNKEMKFPLFKKNIVDLKDLFKTIMIKISYDFVNDVDYEDKNINDYDDIAVVMVVVAVVIEVTNLPSW